VARKRARVIPKNVLAQEELRRKYIEEPWPQKLILVKSTLKDNDIRVRGSITGLFYNLSWPYLYVDERDLAGLGDMIIDTKAEEEVADATIIPGDTKSIATLDSATDANGAGSPGKTTRKRGRPRKGSRSSPDGLSNTGEDGRISAGNNK